MARRIQRINPLDLQPRKAIGVSLPFTGNAVFNSTYTSADALRTNLINFFLTGKNERVLNVNFGAGLRNSLFENLTQDFEDITKADIREALDMYFPRVVVRNLEIKALPERHTVTLVLGYAVRDTNINDEIVINFEQ